MTTENALIWLDLETGGLDVEKQPIFEVACIVTDGDLNELATYEAVAHYEDSVLEAMEDWPKKQHAKSGLIPEIRESKITLAEIENQLLEIIKKHVPARSAPLAGSSVHFDRKFVDKYMPKLGKFVHYRNVDVSTIKELCRRWSPLVIPSMGDSNHRAFDDIRASIRELKIYRKLLWEKKQKQQQIHVHVHLNGKRKKEEEDEEEEEQNTKKRKSNKEEEDTEDKLYKEEVNRRAEALQKAIEDDNVWNLMKLPNFWSKYLIMELAEQVKEGNAIAFYSAIEQRVALTRKALQGAVVI